MTDRGGARKRAYISGPISLGGTCTPEQIAENIARFKQARQDLWARGYAPRDPTEIEKQPSWEEYMKRAIKMVCSADLVVTLPGAEQSVGSVWEQAIAHLLKIPVQSLGVTLAS